MNRVAQEEAMSSEVSESVVQGLSPQPLLERQKSVSNSVIINN